MLFVEVQQSNLKQLINQLTRSTKHNNLQQPIQISKLQPILDHFYKQYFQHLSQSVLITKINDFFCKLLNKIISIDLLEDIYQQLSIHIRKLNRYHNYLKQIDEIVQEQNYQQCLSNRKFSDMLCDPIDLQELNTSDVKSNKIHGLYRSVEYETTTLTLQQDIQNLPEFNFYETVINNEQGQTFQEWTDQFIEKKLQQIKDYKITHQEQGFKHSSKRSSTTSGTKNGSQLTFNRQLELMIKSRISESQEKNDICEKFYPRPFQFYNIDETKIAKSLYFTDKQKQNPKNNPIKEHIITQWGFRSSHIFAQHTQNKVNEMIKKQQEAQMNRAKQIQDLQQRKTVNEANYYKFLRKLKEKAKMKIYSKNHKK